MADLTKIEKPFGLLDEETQKALRECGGPWEVFGETWEDNGGEPAWYPHFTYRLKPQPPKPREWWVNLYGQGRVGSFYSTREDANTFSTPDRRDCVKVREVLE